jgi:hypothetical protein
VVSEGGFEPPRPVKVTRPSTLFNPSAQSAPLLSVLLDAGARVMLRVRPSGLIALRSLDDPLDASLLAVTFDEMEAALKARLEALPPAARAELLHVLRLPDFERADRIGEFWGYPESRAFAELVIDFEEDRILRAVLVGVLREGAPRTSR